jgi:transcription termination factor Rho
MSTLITEIREPAIRAERVAGVRERATPDGKEGEKYACLMRVERIHFEHSYRVRSDRAFEDFVNSHLRGRRD